MRRLIMAGLFFVRRVTICRERSMTLKRQPHLAYLHVGMSAIQRNRTRSGKRSRTWIATAQSRMSVARDLGCFHLRKLHRMPKRPIRAKTLAPQVRRDRLVEMGGRHAN